MFRRHFRDIFWTKICCCRPRGIFTHKSTGTTEGLSLVALERTERKNGRLIEEDEEGDKLHAQC